MIRLFIFSISTIFLFQSCKKDNPKKIDNSIQDIAITVKQNGETINPVDGVLRLQKSAFDMVVDFSSPTAVLVNAAFDDELISIVKSGQSVGHRPEFQKLHTLAVAPQNPDRIIYLDHDSAHPWYFENKEDTNFNQIDQGNNRYHCTRTIAHFSKPDNPGKIKIKEINQPLYLVFAPAVIHDLNPDSVMTAVKYLTIEWLDTSPADATDAPANTARHMMEEVDEEEVDEEDELPLVFSLEDILTGFHIDKSNVLDEFVIVKARPQKPEETIYVIPEIVDEEEDLIEFTLNFFIVNNHTGEVLYNTYESKYINGLTHFQNDRKLKSITMDTAPYYLSEDRRAFGIRVNFEGTSQTEPFNTETLSLYMTTTDGSITKILNNYLVKKYSGKSDGSCNGYFDKEEKILIITEKPTNSFLDLLVKNDQTKFIEFKNTLGDCDMNEVGTKEVETLAYDGDRYIKKGVITANVYLSDQENNGTFLKHAPNGETILLFDHEDQYTLTISDAEKGWFKVERIEGVENGVTAILGGVGWIHHSDIQACTYKRAKVMSEIEDGEHLGYIEEKTKVKVLDKYLNWLLISHNGVKGWVDFYSICYDPVKMCL